MILPARHTPLPAALLAAATLALLAAPLAAQSRAQRDRLAAWVPDGKPIECLTGSQIDQTRVLDNRTIDFILRNGQVFRNMLPNSCPGLGVAQAFQYDTQTPQVCNVDVIRVFQQGPGPRFGASCPLGMFQPMKAAEPAAGTQAKP